MSVQLKGQAPGGPVSLPPGANLKQSRVGKRPIALPKGVTVTVNNGKVEVKGPKGQLSRPLTPNVKVVVENNAVSVRHRKHADLGAKPVDEFVAMISQQVAERTLND